MPTCAGGVDLVGVGGQDEGLGLLVVIGDETVDCGLEVDDALVDPALEAASGEDGEEALDGVKPTGRGESEVKRPARVAAHTRYHLWALVGGAIDENGVGLRCRPGPRARRR